MVAGHLSLYFTTQTNMCVTQMHTHIQIAVHSCVQIPKILVTNDHRVLILTVLVYKK